MGLTSSRRAPAAHILAFALAAAALMAVNGYFFPLALTNDGKTYLGIAEAISTAWREGGSLFDIDQKFRILGFPATIAALQMAFGEKPYLPMYLLQAGMVVAVGTVAFTTLVRLGASSVWAAVLAFLYIAALPAMLASYLLTDTISNGLTAIAACLLAVPLFEPDEPALARTLAAGIAMGLAFFYREANLYLVLCLLPMVLAIAWQRGRALRGAVLVLALLAPVLLASEGYKAFNQARFGERFVTSVGRIVMLHSLLPLAEKRPALFDGETDLDRTARVTLKDFGTREPYWISSKLLAQGYTEMELSRQARSKYLEAWRRFPLLMTKISLMRMRMDKQATELLNPLLGFYNNARWRSDTLDSESKRLRRSLRDGDWVEFLKVLPIQAGRIPSLVLYALFVLGAPVVAVMAWRRNEHATAHGLAALYLAYAGYSLAYGLMHMEMRYLGGIAVILVLGAAVVLRAALGSVRGAEAGKAIRGNST